MNKQASFYKPKNFFSFSKMEHDSLVVARAIGFNRKKELVAFYRDHPQEELQVKNLQLKFVEQFKNEVSKIISISAIKIFQSEFLKKEREEKEKYDREKKEAWLKQIRRSAGTISPNNHVIEIDDFSDTLMEDNQMIQSSIHENLVKQNEELLARVDLLEKENMNLKTKIELYRSVLQKTKRKYNTIIRKVLSFA